MSTPMNALTLEDIVFGVDTREPVKSAVSHTHGPPSRMLVAVTSLVVVAVVLWSLQKSVQYNEVFANNSRYQYGMWALNAVVILAAMAIVVCSCRL